jgi:hypothetical protein
VNEICARNVEISDKFFGETSIYLVRPLYTLYTARLHEESDEGSSAALDRMASLNFNGEPVRTNQFLFKAVLLDAIMLMQ